MNMKIIIIYESTHHGNTKKLVDAISERFGDEYSLSCLSVDEAEGVDLSEYDIIGIASGIAAGNFYQRISEYVARKLPESKNVFFLYTCGIKIGDYSTGIRRTAEEKGCVILGRYGCNGFSDFGPFKLIGGISKRRPNESEIAGAVEFFGNIMGDYVKIDTADN